MTDISGSVSTRSWNTAPCVVRGLQLRSALVTAIASAANLPMPINLGSQPHFATTTGLTGKGQPVADVERRLAEIRRRLGPLTTVRGCDHVNSAKLARRLVELLEIVDELADRVERLEEKTIL